MRTVAIAAVAVVVVTRSVRMARCLSWRYEGSDCAIHRDDGTEGARPGNSRSYGTSPSAHPDRPAQAGAGPATGAGGRAVVQAFVADYRCRPRSGHRAHEDTRITSYRDEGTTTAVR
ncbi:hypothetical protein GCM10010505_26260 [Kitasatospora aburaviensis]